MLPHWMAPGFCTVAERHSPLEFHSLRPAIMITSSQHDLKDEVVAHAEGKSDEQIAAAVMDFSFWWSRDIHPRLNGYGGYDRIQWRILR
jgi:hypothetical protein